MIEKVDHIGIAVEELGPALDFYLRLGLAGTEVEEVPDQRVRVAVLHAGDTRIELLQSTVPDGPVGRFIVKRGEGIHHICFEVADIEQALAELKLAGVKLIDEHPRAGAGGRRIAFLSPRSSHGVLIELSEQPAGEAKTGQQ